MTNEELKAICDAIGEILDPEARYETIKQDRHYTNVPAKIEVVNRISIDVPRPHSDTIAMMFKARNALDKLRSEIK